MCYRKWYMYSCQFLLFSCMLKILTLHLSISKFKCSKHLKTGSMLVKGSFYSVLIINRLKNGNFHTWMAEGIYKKYSSCMKKKSFYYLMNTWNLIGKLRGPLKLWTNYQQQTNVFILENNDHFWKEKKVICISIFTNTKLIWGHL